MWRRKAAASAKGRPKHSTTNGTSAGPGYRKRLVRTSRRAATPGAAADRRTRAKSTDPGETTATSTYFRAPPSRKAMSRIAWLSGVSHAVTRCSVSTVYCRAAMVAANQSRTALCGALRPGP
eukprot:8287111-Alexandrium_andersonii.AAC.1